MGNEVKIKLTDAQRAKIKSATGKEMTEIRVGSLGNNPAVSASKKTISARSARELSARSARELSARSAKTVSARSARELSARSARELSARSAKNVTARATKANILARAMRGSDDDLSQ